MTENDVNSIRVGLERAMTKWAARAYLVGLVAAPAGLLGASWAGSNAGLVAAPSFVFLIMTINLLIYRTFGSLFPMFSPVTSYRFHRLLFSACGVRLALNKAGIETHAPDSL